MRLGVLFAVSTLPELVYSLWSVWRGERVRRPLRRAWDCLVACLWSGWKEHNYWIFRDQGSSFTQVYYRIADCYSLCLGTFKERPSQTLRVLQLPPRDPLESSEKEPVEGYRVARSGVADHALVSGMASLYP